MRAQTGLLSFLGENSWPIAGSLPFYRPPVSSLVCGAGGGSAEGFEAFSPLELGPARSGRGHWAVQPGETEGRSSQSAASS